MRRGRSTAVLWAIHVLLFCGAAAPAFARPITTFDVSPVVTVATKYIPPASTHIIAKPHEIEPPAPKFKTVADEGRSEPNLSVLAKNNLSSYDDENLVLRTTEFLPGMYQGRIPVGNGYWGTTVAAAGPFYEKDINQTNYDGTVTEGWPLFNDRQTFATISGFFDAQRNTTRTNYAPLLEEGWESVISGIPCPLSLNLVVEDQVLNSTVDPATISNFVQSWNLRDGLTQWSYTWSPNNARFDIEYIASISRDNPNKGAVELRVTPLGGNYNASIVDLLDGRCAQRSHLVEKAILPYMDQIYVGVHPEGLPNVTAFIISTADVSNGHTVESSRRTATAENDMTIGQEWDVNLIDGETAIFRKFVGVASSDKFQQPRLIANDSSTKAASDGWDATMSTHINTWNKLMSRNFIADYRDPSTGKLPENSIVEKFQPAAVVDRYISLIHLLPENGRNLNDVGISPTGISADSYGGMLFWDQDLWVFPAMAATNPEYAMQLPKSRVKLLEAAKANTQLHYVKGEYSFDSDSVLFPWTSGRYGNATATGPALDYQYHLNSDIALEMLQFRRITGNEMYFRENIWPAIKSIGHTITTLLKKDAIGYSIWNMTDPDEYAAKVDNGAYTLSSFSRILHEIITIQERYEEPVNRTWIDMANNVNIFRAASGITQQYQGMYNNVTIKQADAQLMTYPWHYTNNYTLDNKRMDLAYYNQKQNPDGPAMTFAINAIVEGSIAESGCAASTYHHKATIPYLRAPWFIMSEVPNDDVNGNGGVSPAFPFVTGHGGAAQIPLFGYVGLDLTQDNLTIQPSLPPPIEHLRVPDFYFQGAKFSAAMNSTHTVLTRLPSPDTDVTQDVYAGRSMPVVIGSPKGRREQKFDSIVVGQTLTIANDMYWQKSATKGNIAQCQATTTNSDSVSGKPPGAATDGNTETVWQPNTVSPSTLTVNTGTVPFQQVQQINFNWGARPALKAKVGFTNSSDVDSFDDSRMSVVDLGDITANRSYYVLNETEPIPYVGNTTVYMVTAQAYTGKFAWLQVEGCNGCDMLNPIEKDFGPTVGEFEIIGTMGNNVLG